MRSYSSPRRNFRHELRLLLAPYILGSLLLIGLPALLAFGLAFTEYDALAMPRWNGLENFRLVFAEPLFWIALRNSLYLIILATPLRVGAALALALLLWRQRRGVGFFRTAIYVPTAIPEAAYALIWLWIVNPLYGPLNLALRGLGLPAPAWSVDPATARLVFVMMTGFQIGEGLAIMIAALRAIPPQSLEAAAIDGAGTWGRFRSIVLPLLTPWLLLLSVRDILLSFQTSFTPSLLMTGGDPYYATLFLPLLIYEEAFAGLRFGAGSAMMLLMFLASSLLIIALGLIFNATGWLDGE